jgi:hypothetical protein
MDLFKLFIINLDLSGSTSLVSQPTVIVRSDYADILVARLIAFIYILAASRQKQHNGFATSMDTDQPAHLRSLIRIHAVRL